MIGAGALAAPFGAIAQQSGRVWRVGFLGGAARPAVLDAGFHGDLVRGLRELGYVEGKNLALEWRFADNKPDRLNEMAAELVRLKMDVIVSGASGGPLALQKITSTIPIVMASVGDAVGQGLVKSLARPGGNITGVSTITADLGSKRLELLLTMVPRLSRVAVMVNPNAKPNIQALENIQAAAPKRRVTIIRADASTPAEIDQAFALMAREKAGGLIVVLNPLFQRQREQIAQLSAKYRLPSMTADRVYTDAGCLLSYGVSIRDTYHRAATYVDKILKGAKPGDLPVELPTKFEFIINRKTAKALGLTIPKELLLQANRVIE